MGYWYPPNKLNVESGSEATFCPHVRCNGLSPYSFCWWHPGTVDHHKMLAIPFRRQQASWTNWLRRMRILTMPAPSIPTSLAPSFSRNFGSIFHGKIWEDGRCFTWGNSRGMAPHVAPHVAECSFLGWFQRTVLRRFWCPTFGPWQDGTGMLVLSVFWLNFETQMPCKTGRQIVIYIIYIYIIYI